MEHIQKYNVASPSRVNKVNAELMETCYQPRNEGPIRIPDKEVNFSSFFTLTGTKQQAKPNITKKEDKANVEVEGQLRSNTEREKEYSKHETNINSKEATKQHSHKELNEVKKKESLPEIIQEESKFESIAKPQSTTETKRVCYSEILEKEVKRSLHANKRKKSIDDTCVTIESNSKRRITTDDVSTKETVTLESDPEQMQQSIKDIRAKISLAKNLLRDTQNILISIEAISKAKRKKSSVHRKSEATPSNSFFSFIERILIAPVIVLNIENGSVDQEEIYIITIGTKEISKQTLK